MSGDIREEADRLVSDRPDFAIEIAKSVIQAGMLNPVGHEVFGISKRNREILDFISAFYAEHNYSPSFEEIGAGIGVRSKGRIGTHLRDLRKMKYLNFIDGKSRSIILTKGVK